MDFVSNDVSEQTKQVLYNIQVGIPNFSYRSYQVSEDMDVLVKKWNSYQGGQAVNPGTLCLF